MDRSELRQNVLKGFYENEDGRYHDPFAGVDDQQKKIAIESACRHLAQQGLIEWTPVLGETIGHGRITGSGAEYYEGGGKPVSNIFNIGNVHGNNIQFGDGNAISTNTIAGRVYAAIESSQAPEDQKSEAKSLWAKLSNNQTFAAVVGAILTAAGAVSSAS